MVGVDYTSLQADSQPKSVGLIWGSMATWHGHTFTKWTGWILAVATPLWQYHKHCPDIIIITVIIIKSTWPWVTYIQSDYSAVECQWEQYVAECGHYWHTLTELKHHSSVHGLRHTRLYQHLNTAELSQYVITHEQWQSDTSTATAH